MKAIRVENLVKVYNEDVLAVDGISFDVDKNSFFAFLGPNGAGKSTTINIISTLLEKSEGRVFVFDHEVNVEDMKIKEKIGVVFQSSMLDTLLTVRENLDVRASFYGIGSEELDNRLEEIDVYLNFKSFLDKRYGNLSGGQKRKADIARALLNWPEILILDEPTTGLDPKSRKDIWDLINKLRNEKEITIFLTTHYMEEVLDASKIVVIDQGKIVAQGSSEELRLKYSNDRIKILPKKGLKEELTKDKVEYYMMNDTLNIILEDCFDGIQYVEKYRKWINEFEILRGDMDDVFLSITGRKLGDE